MPMISVELVVFFSESAFEEIADQHKDKEIKTIYDAYRFLFPNPLRNPGGF